MGGQHALTVKVSDNLSVVKPRGYIDEISGVDLRTLVIDNYLSGNVSVILDFSGASHINSAVITNLIEICDYSLDSCPDALIFCGLSPLMREAFEVVGIDSLVKILKDEKTARGFFLSGDNGSELPPWSPDSRKP